MKKLLLVFVASLVTVLVCYGTGFAFGPESFVFSWVLNFSLMAWYTYVASQYQPKLKSPYFEEKHFEQGGRIYQYLGVHPYKKLLVWVGWEKMVRKEISRNDRHSTLRSLEYHTRSSEAGHTLIALLVFLTAAFLDSLAQAKWLLLTNLLLNIYPIMLQRYNRPRYRRILQRNAPSRD